MCYMKKIAPDQFQTQKISILRWKGLKLSIVQGFFCTWKIYVHES